MDELRSMVIAGVAGLAAGFAASVPVGPINVAIIEEGARRGFKWGLLIGLGSVLMELIYCTMAFAGLSTVFDSRMVRATLELVSFLLLLYLGIKYLLLRSVPAEPRSAERLEEKLHPHSAFMIGFVRVLGNPSIVLFWMTIAASFSAHSWVDNVWFEKAVCIGGVGVGATLWFAMLSYTVSIAHRRLSENTLLRISHVSGILLLVLAAVIGVRIISLLARHGPHAG